MKKTLMGIAAGIALTFGTAAQADYTPITEFNKMDNDQQFQIVENALARIYNYYSQVKPDVNKTSCILDLFNNPDKEFNGYDHFGFALQVGLTNDRVDEITVENILLGIINTECTAEEYLADNKNEENNTSSPSPTPPG